MTPPPTTMVMNRPEAAAVNLPRPSVARLKITPHMTDVQMPHRMMSSTLTGTSAPWRVILTSSGMKMATRSNRMASDDVQMSCERGETLPEIRELLKRPTSMSSQ